MATKNNTNETKFIVSNFANFYIEVCTTKAHIMRKNITVKILKYLFNVYFVDNFTFKICGQQVSLQRCAN